MMRRKNLERAVILGLLLSTSVYGSALAAEEVTTAEFVKGQYTDGTPIDGVSINNNVIEVTKDIVVTGTNENIDQQWNPNKTINVSDGVNLQIDKTWLTSSNITGNGNITVNSTNGTPIFIGGNITANNLVLNTNSGNGIYLYEHDLTLDVEHLTINCATNGIIQEVSEGNTPLTTPSTTTIDNTQSIDINSSNSWAIHNNSQPNVLNNIYMRSDKSESYINAFGANGVSNTSSGETVLKADNINIGSWSSYGVYSGSGGKLEIEAKENVFIGDKFIDEDRIGDYATQAAHAAAGTMLITAKEGNVTIIGNEGVFTDRKYDGTATITAGQNNYIYAGTNTLQAAGGNITVSGQNNFIKADSDVRSSKFDFEYGDSLAISPENSSITTVTATGENGLNDIRGAVSAAKGASTVNITGFSNNVYSAAVIDGAGDLAGKTQIDNPDPNGDKFTGMDVVSALYAEEGAEINLSGVNNIQTYYGDPKDEHTSERAVWAYKGANITLDGTTNISTYKYEISPENRDIAIAAGTATELTDKDFTDTALEEVQKNLATVNLNYQAGSSISGDILAAYGGEVNIKDNNITTASVGRSGAATGINITGDLLAGNTGKLTVDLGNGGSLTGRADDYGDASTEHITLYNPAFSSNIIQGGDITLNMGDGSQWNVQGQSWITNVNATGNVLIDLTSAENQYKNYDSHALTIRNLNGDANIKMDLNGDRSQSDMLYIGQGNGEYNIELAELVTVDDMYAQLDNNTKFSGLRFATVGAGSDVKFNVTAKDQGFNNVIYTVDTDVYNSAESAHENNAYNGEKMTEEKPGNSLVDDLLNGKQNASTESGIATLAANDVMLLADENDTENDNKTQHLNYKLVDMQSDGPTDAGKTMLNMSRANYSNAIYMDRLNKRLGEARYINDDPEEDEGMWVRIRHDRIGKEDAFRSQNTMYELGYDKRQECDNGKRRVGFAVDYMHGDTGYSDIAGKGEIDRYGLWLYDTWTGNKGHYADYVAKWGHLQNDFEVYTMTGGEKVTGDYSNNVFSISAEYGRKKDMGNDWYIEPQAQLQLARVTGADYTTSQGTKVSVDGINSLIGRAGFRLGKDFGEEKQSTVYFKADVLHEFLGDQTIRAMDGTTNGWQTVDYENKGTWYDIGIGYAAMLSQSTYAFIDLEQSFGNDNDDTYQINAGVRWTF